MSTLSPPPSPDSVQPELKRYQSAQNLVRWFIPVGALLSFFGYWGPWIAHPTAALTLSGIDLGEFVKFLPSVRSGEIALFREWFYTPAVTISLGLSLAAFRPEYGYNFLARLSMVMGGMAAAGWLLPPAWSPAILLTPEFRLQTGFLVFCLLIALAAPFTALLPRMMAFSTAGVFIVAAAMLPLWNLTMVWAAVGHIYAAPLQIGWGPLLLLPGLLLMLVGWGLQPLPRRNDRSMPSRLPRHHSYSIL